MNEQKTNFEKTFDLYVKGEEQRDDITVLGIKV
jgi:hypothetical protein